MLFGKKRQDVHVINPFCPHIQVPCLLSLSVLAGVASPHLASGNVTVRDGAWLCACGLGTVGRGSWGHVQKVILRQSCVSGPGITVPPLCTCSLCPAPRGRPISAGHGARPGHQHSHGDCPETGSAPSPGAAAAGTVLHPPALHRPSPHPSLRRQGQADPEHKARALCRVEDRHTADLSSLLLGAEGPWEAPALGSRGPDAEGSCRPRRGKLGSQPWGSHVPRGRTASGVS